MTGRRAEGVPGTGRTVLAAMVAGVASGTTAAGVTRSVLRWPSALLPGGADRWTRTNHRGGSVTLVEGPAWVAGALAGMLGAPGRPRLSAARLGAVLATAAGGGLGLLDDLAGDGRSKGLRGHLGALTRGEVTTGAIKVAGLAGAGVLAAALAGTARRGPGDASGGVGRVGRVGRLGRAVGGAAAGGADALLGGAVVAGTANLVNLFDLRPGRALKVTLLLAGPVLALGGASAPGGPAGAPRTGRGSAVEVVSWCAAAIGASVAALPSDLDEHTMLGDTGANAAGALLGTAFVSRTGRRTQMGALAVLAALTVASERISFTRVIERTPALARLDRLGRRDPGT